METDPTNPFDSELIHKLTLFPKIQEFRILRLNKTVQFHLCSLGNHVVSGNIELCSYRFVGYL